MRSSGASAKEMAKEVSWNIGINTVLNIGAEGLSTILKMGKVDVEGPREIRGGFGSKGQDVAYLSDFFEGADDGILRGFDEPTFYSVKNSNGGKIYVSTDKIKQSHFADIVNNTDGTVNIITGAHGTMDGTLSQVPPHTFFKDDTLRWGNTPNVNVIDITTLDANQLSDLLNSSDTTICAWCLSERSELVLKALGLIK